MQETPESGDEETGKRNNWLLTSIVCQEPAYSMLNIEAGEGLLRPPSNPLPFGDCAPGPPVAVRRG